MNIYLKVYIQNTGNEELKELENSTIIRNFNIPLSIIDGIIRK